MTASLSNTLLSIPSPHGWVSLLSDGDSFSSQPSVRLLAAAEVPLDGARLGGGQAELLLAPLDPALACSVRVSFSHTLLPPGYRAKPTKRAASTEPTGMSVQVVSVSVT